MCRVPPPWLLTEQLLLPFESTLAWKFYVLFTFLILLLLSIFLLALGTPVKTALVGFLPTLTELVHPPLIVLKLITLSSRLIFSPACTMMDDWPTVLSILFLIK